MKENPSTTPKSVPVCKPAKSGDGTEEGKLRENNSTRDHMCDTSYISVLTNLSTGSEVGGACSTKLCTGVSRMAGDWVGGIWTVWGGSKLTGSLVPS